MTCRDCKLEGKLRGESFRLLRNFFFAKHGHIFQSADLTEYFSRFDWYKPTRTVAFEELSEAERWNIEIIRKFEQMNENSQTVVWGPEKEGVWQDHFVMAAGWGDRFVIYADNRMEFLFSQMSELQLIKGLAGTYEIRGNVLIFAVPQFCLTYDRSAAAGPPVGAAPLVLLPVSAPPTPPLPPPSRSLHPGRRSSLLLI